MDEHTYFPNIIIASVSAQFIAISQFLDTCKIEREALQMQRDRATRLKYETSHLQRHAIGVIIIRGMTSKDTQGYYNCCY